MSKKLWATLGCMASVCVFVGGLFLKDAGMSHTGAFFVGLTLAHIS